MADAGARVGMLCHDGVMVRRGGQQWDDPDFLQQATEYIANKEGLKMRIVVKPPQTIPEALLSPGAGMRGVMEPTSVGLGHVEAETPYNAQRMRSFVLSAAANPAAADKAVREARAEAEAACGCCGV